MRFQAFSYHFLIFLTALVMTLGFNIDFFYKLSDLTSFSTLCLSMVFLSLIFASVLEMICFYWNTKIICGIFLCFCAFCSYFVNVLHIGITPDVIQSTLNTNISEASGFLNTYFFIYVLGICTAIIFALYKIKIKKAKNLLSAIIIKLLLLGAYLGGAYGLWFGVIGKDLVLQLRPLASIILPISPIRSSILLYNAKQKLSLSYQHIAIDARLASHTPKKILVLILGESVRSANVNGYNRELMPKFNSLSQTINFSNFSSCGVITAISVPCMLTSHTQESYTNRYLSNYIDNILDITQRAGIQTYWIDNNSGSAKSCIGGLCDRIEHKYFFDGMDGLIFQKLQEILEHTTQSSFIILHTYGSHGPDYFHRYPQEFEIYKPTCKTSALNQCTPQEILNSYDNSIVYTDSLLYGAIKELEKMQDKFEVSLWFVSDHGESLGEGGQYMHGGLPYSLSPDFQTKVASMMWFGKGLQSYYQTLKSKENTPLSQDYIFHSILGYFGIETKDYNPKLDLAK